MKRTFDLVLAGAILVFATPVYLVLRVGKKIELQRILVGFSEKRQGQILLFSRAKIKFWWFLPAIPNILKGELSFVGRDMVFALDDGHVGFSLKPGLTGLEHVNRNGELSEDDRKRYHLYYLKNYSPFLDVEIMVKTILKRRF